MNNTLNYYELLGISKSASKEEIKSAYKKQMKKWHPDINKSDDAKSMSIKLNEAKEILLDDIKRANYDEYLNKKIEESYNKYTQRKQTSNKNYTNDNHKYEDKKVTKWEYLSQWLKYANVSTVRKAFGLIGVIIESTICFFIKVLIIVLAYISNTGSYIIRMLFSYLSPLLGLLLLLLIGQCFTTGFTETIKSNTGALNMAIIFVTLFILSFLLPLLSNLMLSPKTFYILYNKIDINLFKKCVGYKEV